MQNMYLKYTILKVQFLSKNSILTKLYLLTFLNFRAKIGRNSQIFWQKKLPFIEVEIMDKKWRFGTVCINLPKVQLRHISYYDRKIMDKYSFARQ